MRITRVFKLLITHAVAVAVSTQVATAALQAPLPEFKSKAELQQIAQARHAAATAAETGTFYTGKPYDIASNEYIFRFRNYKAEFSRWTSTDASGFPDGANNHSYIRNNPNCWLDSSGLSGTLVINSSSDGTSSSSTSGHSWVSYTPDGGSTTTYGTWSNNPQGLGNGLHENLEQGFTPDVSRPSHLSDEQEQAFNNTVSDYENRGANGWSYTNPCSGFASTAWHNATGEALNDGWPVSAPTTLKNSIFHANGNQETGIYE